ncbi:MAG: SagB/ThcOx family dehydrogenase [Candidatus Sungbacteria bacterium]|uniref:SagB/ThcOx family dehydrogenase n=1 Tax=Candidatus Sungiibacteriota bacterium TaxID=2750080 RepID=A0A9D6LQ81_9BACT|nr:SagB/ThcOx family dehydrogenase [Candidatus Sungbacteria bacterium]
MNSDFSRLFHSSSKDHAKGHPPIPFEEWPDEWKTIYYKSYPRLPKIDLANISLRADFFDLIKQRRSRRDFNREPIMLHELSVLLKHSCGENGIRDNQPLRAQPSAGGRFPIEIYPLIFRPSKDIIAGLYHYNVKTHQLDILEQREFTDAEIDSYFTYPWVKNASVVLLMSAVFWRTQNKYGERGYRYIFIESGHIGQNVYLTTNVLGLKCCALVGTRDESLERLLNIDGVNESLIYTLAIGH